jgi:hypothetical protein
MSFELRATSVKMNVQIFFTLLVAHSSKLAAFPYLPYSPLKPLYMDEKKAAAPDQQEVDWKDKLENKAEEIKDKAGEVWEKIEDKAEDVWQEVKEKAEDLKEGAEKVWNKIVDKFDGDEEKPAEPKQN